MTIHYIIQAIFVIVGIVSILAAILNWEWFFNAQNSQFIVKSLGRKKARAFYAILGIVMIGIGIYFYTQIENI